MKGWQVRDKIHELKGYSGLRGPENVVIYLDNGDVEDEDGNPLGNVHD
jgi:hypothetical protein